MQNKHLALLILVGACTSSGSGEGTSSSEIRGDAAFRDAATDHAGQPQQPAAPTQSAKLSIVMHGNGQFSLSDVDPRCALDPAGQFQAVLSGTASMDNGSAYVAALASGSGAVTTASGCSLPSVASLIVTDAKLRAEITTTTQSCSAYCAASARADAESECGATASAASCRASTETSAAASCQTQCTTQSHSIVAETSLATSLFTGLDFTDLKAAEIGDLQANLTFDHLE
jgi:hypothetical protein